MSAFLRKYGVTAIIDGIPLVTRNAMDLKSSPTLAAGDVTIEKDGVADGNLDTLPAVTPAAGTSVRVSLAAVEMQCARAVIRFIDQTSPKEWEDQEVIVETFGHASAQFQVDLSDGVRAGLTALANAAAGGAGGAPVLDGSAHLLIYSVATAVPKSPATLDWSADVTNKPTIGTLTAQQVWEYATRSLSTFGTLVADIRAGLLTLFQTIARKDSAAPVDMAGTFDPATDSLEAAAERGVTIKTKTDLIGSATITWTSPVAANGTAEITQGDDYQDAGAMLTWTFTGYAGPSLTSASVALMLTTTAAYQTAGDLSPLTVAGTLTVNGTTVIAFFPLTAAQSAALEGVPPDDKYNYVYQIIATRPTAKPWTLAQGALNVRRSLS